MQKRRTRSDERRYRTVPYFKLLSYSIWYHIQLPASILTHSLQASYVYLLKGQTHTTTMRFTRLSSFGSCLTALIAWANVVIAQQDPSTLNGGSILAMAGKDCVAVAVDKRFGSGPQVRFSFCAYIIILYCWILWHHGTYLTFYFHCWYYNK